MSDERAPVGTCDPLPSLVITLPLDDALFRDEVDAALLTVVADGTWQTLYDQWFPAPAPWAIADVLDMEPADY